MFKPAIIFLVALTFTAAMVPFCLNGSGVAVIFLLTGDLLAAMALVVAIEDDDNDKGATA